jgi:hypothetical protein
MTAGRAISRRRHEMASRADDGARSDDEPEFHRFLARRNVV